MAHTKEYIEAIFKAAKGYLPSWVWQHLHKIAFRSRGGTARHRKGIEKQAAPISPSGLDADAIVTALQIRGEQYSKAEATYVEPTTDMTACGACRFFLRSPHEERGLCQAITGPVAWFGSCQFYISAWDEAFFALEKIIQKQGFEVQTIVFPKARWTLARARKWLTDHDFIFQADPIAADRVDPEEESVGLSHGRTIHRTGFSKVARLAGDKIIGRGTGNARSPNITGLRIVDSYIVHERHLEKGVRRRRPPVGRP